jgi:hypothetical protein
VCLFLLPFQPPNDPVTFCPTWRTTCHKPVFVEVDNLNATHASSTIFRDGNTESDFEQETPRNNKLKKVACQISRPGDLEEGVVNIDADAAEKWRRRKSTKLTIIESVLAQGSAGTLTASPPSSSHGNSMKAVSNEHHSPFLLPHLANAIPSSMTVTSRTGWCRDRDGKRAEGDYMDGLHEVH